MKILFAFYADSKASEAAYHQIAADAPSDLEVVCFNLNLDLRKSKLDWPRLDKLWRTRDARLMALYASLGEAAQDCDVLLVYNGRNVHPEFASTLNTFNVFSCFDDPESSAKLSYPVAPAFDGVFFGNIASAAQYRSWGCDRIAFLPIFVPPAEVPAREERDLVLGSDRDNDLVLVCGRNDKRRLRMDALIDAFPQAEIYGRNWNRGWISDDGLRDLYLSSKIGWNIHNSTGPINKRLFALAAFGIMPLCDNKTGLGGIFELGREAVGGDTIPEMVELTRYYLAHDEERRKIAHAAYERYWQDYAATAIWRRIKRQLLDWGAGQKQERNDPANVLSKKAPLESAPAVRAENRLKHFANGVIRYLGQKQNRKLENISPWYDERFYLGERVPLTESTGVVRFKRPPPLGDQVGFASKAHQEVRIWAQAVLAGDAGKILCEGGAAEALRDLLEMDSKREVRLTDELTGGESSIGMVRRHDLLLNTDIIDTPERLHSSFLRWRTMAANVIFSYLLDARDNVKSCARAALEMQEWLDQYCDAVRVFHMPDIYVPWIEPATQDNTGRLLLVKVEVTGY